ncbi:MAG TPA: hypothetical protein VFB85_09340, partial [Vicinamibacterales bacterium]|nr:hypothetical protein [Vicinamibacterales bacterium]
MSNSARINWVRAVGGGFLAELGILAVVIPIALVAGQQPQLLATPPTALVMVYVATLWALRTVESRLVLHGFLVGLFAVLIYEAVAITQPRPVPLIIAEGMKIAGGITAAVVVQRKRTTIASRG